MINRRVTVSTGSKALDALFGGYQSGTIMLFYSTSWCGKTTLATYIPFLNTYKHLKETGKLKDKTRFIMMDGDGGFDIDRANEIWGNNLSSDDLKDLISKVEYTQPTEFDAQHKYVTEELKKKIEENKWEPAVISLDPMIAIYRGIVLRSSGAFKMATIGSYTGKLDLQLAELRRLSLKYNAIATASTWSGSLVGKNLKAKDDQGNVIEQTKPEQPFIGGREFGFLCKSIIEIIAESESSPLRTARLWKFRSKLAGESCKFTLCNEGVKDVA